jgi:hypothetical protein
MEIVMGPPPACFSIAAQVSASGFQVCAAACSGVSSGRLLLAEMQRRSISPMRMRSPFDSTRIGAEPLPKSTSMRHESAAGAGSRHRNVGGAMSGGNTDPLSG